MPRKKGKKQSVTLETSAAPTVITDEEWETLFRRSVLLRPLGSDGPPVHDLMAALASGVMDIESRVTGARPRAGTRLTTTSDDELGNAGVELEPDDDIEPLTDATRDMASDAGTELATTADLAVEPEVPARAQRSLKITAAAFGLLPAATESEPDTADEEAGDVGVALTGRSGAAFSASLELEPEADADVELAVGVDTELEPARIDGSADESAPAALTEEEWRERFFKRGQLTGLMEGDDLLILTAPDVAGGVTTLRLRGHALRTVAAAALQQAPAGFGWRDHDDLVLLGIVLDWCLRGVALESRPAAVRDAVWGMAERYPGFMERLGALLPPR